MNTSLLAYVSLENIDNLLADWALRLLTAAIIFFVGKWIAERIRALFVAACERRQVDPLLSSFGSSVAFYLLMAVVVVATLSKLGVPTTSVVAILGAASLAVGLALQGSLSNFASGVMILIFRPFKTGDFILAGGTSGIVEGIDLLTTVLKTPDGKKVICPNGKILGDVITNITAHDIRRVDMTFGIAYSDDIDKAKEVIAGVMEKDERILKDPAITIAVAELADNSVNIVVRPWVNKADWWPVFTESLENIKKAFDANGISIPFPQRDVHLYQESK